MNGGDVCDSMRRWKRQLSEQLDIVLVLLFPAEHVYVESSERTSRL